MSQAPQPLQYATRPAGDRRAVRKFLIGLGVGVGVVAVGAAAIVVADTYSALFVAFLVTPFAALLLGLALAIPKPSRMIGAGVLAVAGVLALVLGTFCAAGGV